MYINFRIHYNPLYTKYITCAAFTGIRDKWKQIIVKRFTKTLLQKHPEINRHTFDINSQYSIDILLLNRHVCLKHFVLVETLEGSSSQTVKPV